MDKCENCRFYDVHVSSTGLCRRYPPSESNTQDVTGHPLMVDEDWCGEFQPNETELTEGNPVLHLDMNVMVSVELTEHGLSVLKKYYTDIRCDIQENFGKDNLYKRTLCYLFHIFGPNCYNGAENVFVNNKITIQP